jgi:hypothetical protein
MSRSDWDFSRSSAIERQQVMDMLLIILRLPFAVKKENESDHDVEKKSMQNQGTHVAAHSSASSSTSSSSSTNSKFVPSPSDRFLTAQFTSDKGTYGYHSNVGSTTSKTAEDDLWSHCSGPCTFMGFCKLPLGHPQYSGVHRRIDIKLWPAQIVPYALLYFTGSDHFNRSMRFYANRCQWTLSDKGLCPCIRVNGDRVFRGRSVLAMSEQDVFKALGLKYVAPDQRNCFELVDIQRDTSVQIIMESSHKQKEEESDEQQVQDDAGKIGFGSNVRVGVSIGGVDSEVEKIKNESQSQRHQQSNSNVASSAI